MKTFVLDQTNPLVHVVFFSISHFMAVLAGTRGKEGAGAARMKRSKSGSCLGELPLLDILIQHQATSFNNIQHYPTLSNIEIIFGEHRPPTAPAPRAAEYLAPRHGKVVARHAGVELPSEIRE